MKMNSKLLAASVSIIYILSSSGAYAGKVSISDVLTAVGTVTAVGVAISNSGNQNTRKAPAGHKNLGPVSKQRNQELLRSNGRAPAKQAPRPKNAPSAVAKSAPKQAPVAVARRVADPAVLEAQKNLAALGFTEVGKPDGFVGKGTASAVKNFQRSNGLPETGVLSATVIALIAKDAAENTANPIEALTEVAEITKEEPKPDEIAVSQPVVEPAPVVEKAPEKAPEPVPTAVAQVAVPETKTPEPAVIEEPATTENEW